MQLKLTVTNGIARSLGDNAQHVFDQSGGTIGRASHNDWILPDDKRFVSSVHASIEAREGGFYIVDTSMNGVYVNGSRTPLGPTAPYLLSDGTRLRMGNYRISVSHVDSLLKEDQQTLLRGDFFEDKLEAEPSAEFSVDLLVEDEIAENIDLSELLDDRMLSANQSMVSSLGSGKQRNTKNYESSSQGDSTQQFTATVHRLPVSATPKGTEAHTVGDLSDTAYSEMVRGLGVDPAALEAREPEEIAFAVGQALRASLQGIKAMKSARARSKQRLALAQTQQDVDDLTDADVNEDIADLLLGRGQLHRRASDNITADTRALMQHNLALQKASQAAISEFIDQLDPDALQVKLESHGAGKGLFTASRKANLWDHYRHFHDSISQREGEELPQFVREEFARAYTARLQTLASSDD